MKKLTILCGTLLYPSPIVSKLVLGLKKARSFQEIGKWWLETILGQIWRLWRLARPPEHPWGRGILHGKLTTRNGQYLHIYKIQEELIPFQFNSTNNVSIADISQHRKHRRWCTKIDKYQVWMSPTHSVAEQKNIFSDGRGQTHAKTG